MKKISVGMATCGISAGSDKVYKVFETLITDSKTRKADLSATGCIGSCFAEVIVEIVDEKKRKFTYSRVTPDIAQAIWESHVLKNKPLEDRLFTTDYFDSQKKIVLRNTGLIDPDRISEYTARRGYEALKKVLQHSDPGHVCETIKKSGLRGRGGAGFSTGIKWELAAKEPGPRKYMICNADEGDPGAFMDRSVLEGDPHSVLEGLTIAGYAIGASEGFIYVRAEYPLAIRRLETALSQARKEGFLGKKILGTDFSFDISLKIGAGAFVCGEETALMASVEGKRGMPRLRPPYPSQSGLWGKPSVINNVETLATIPWIILEGWETFSSIGTEKSKGTKVFALTGKIVRSGLVEVPMGVPLQDVIYKIGGGIQNGKKLKAVQMGGPSGGCLPAELLSIDVDYEHLVSTGAVMGSGGMVVMDEDTCMVDVARFFMNFIRDESCGKCTFCRVGTKRMHELLEKMTQGKAVPEDIKILEELAAQIRLSSLCALGQTAPNPVLTTLKYFRDEYIEHIEKKKCRSKVCKPLLTWTVIPDKCTCCTLCARNCPADCISGSSKQVHFIDQKRCIKCGNCFTACKFKAINVE
jgi:NADH-quinone oxidoreductase subunit F